MNQTKKTFALAQLAVRHFSRTAPQNTEAVPARIARLRENQRKFGEENGIPVYIKGGVSDRILYGATWALTFIGLAGSLHTFYVLSKK